MTRFQALRRMRCDLVTAAFIALMNWMADVPQGEIRFMSVVIEFDPEEPA